MPQGTIGIAPGRVSGLQKDYSAKAHSAEENNDEQFFLAFEAFLKADYQQREDLIEKILGIKSGVKTFVVGEVFGHRAEGLVPQYFGDNFKKLWESAKAKIIPISAFGKNILKQYILPENMKDTLIQNATNSKPIEEDQFWAMLYLLIVEPKLGRKIFKYSLKKDKVYVFHAKFSDGSVRAVRVRWGGGEWFCIANKFDRDNPWRQGFVFLYPVTAKAYFLF